MELRLLLFIFVLAAFLGFELIAKVPLQRHTPLMSGANAIFRDHRGRCHPSHAYKLQWHHRLARYFRATSPHVARKCQGHCHRFGHTI